MARLYLFAEGQTEQTFADTVLKPHLANFGVFMHSPVLIAHARRKGRVHRGGGRKYLPMKNDILRFLKQESGGDVYFTTMIDLYAMPNDFPSRVECEKLSHVPMKRVECLESAWETDVGDARFIPFVQLHEYEAYLFSDVTEFEFFYENAESQIDRLQQIAEEFETPELINDGQHTAPSKRIIDEFPEYESGKTTVGPQMGELIGLNNIRSKCPHFDGWLSHLESIGGENEAT